MAAQALALPRPRGPGRAFLRLPIWLYRLGLGRLLGRGVLLLTHRGRKSGQPRQTVLQVFHHAPAADVYYVVAMRGAGADWVRSIQQTPEVAITVGRRHTPAVATAAPIPTAERLLRHYARRHPRQARAMLRRLIPEVVPDADSYDLLARQVVVVAVRPRPPAAAPPPAPAPPRGLLKIFFNLPNLFYRWGLGWLMGRLFMQVTHTGRKSGLPRQTVLQVMRHTPATNTYYVFAGWGDQSDWVRNIQQTPEVLLTVGRRRTLAMARVLSTAEAEQALTDFTRQHPLYSRLIYRLCGVPVDGSPATYRALARRMGSLLVAFQAMPVPAAEDTK